MDKRSQSQEGLSLLENKTDHLTRQEKGIITMGIEISEFKKSSFLVLTSHKEVKSRAIEAERDYNKAPETILESGSRENIYAGTVPFVTEKLTYACVERAVFHSVFDEMMLLVQQMSADVGESLYSLSKKV